MKTVRMIIMAFGLTFGCVAVTAQTLDDGYAALYGDRGRDAVEEAERVTAALPTSSEAWQVQARAYMRRAEEVNIFRKIKRLKSALAAYERAAELDPSNIEAQLALLVVYSNLPESLGGGEARADAHLQTMAMGVPGLDELGRAMLAQIEEADEAKLAAFARAIEINPDEPEFRIALLRNYSLSEDWDAAWKVLDAARDRFPDYPPLAYQQARLAGLSGQRLDQGLDEIEMLKEREELPPRIRPEALLIVRGHIYQRQGNLEAALADFSNASETAPYLIEQLDLGDNLRDLKRRSR